MKYYIIFPSGNRGKIDVAHSSTEERDDYALASRSSFEDEEEAVSYAIRLASENYLIYTGAHFDKYGEKEKHSYLD